MRVDVRTETLLAVGSHLAFVAQLAAL